MEQARLQTDTGGAEPHRSKKKTQKLYTAAAKLLSHCHHCTLSDTERTAKTPNQTTEHCTALQMSSIQRTGLSWPALSVIVARSGSPAWVSFVSIWVLECRVGWRETVTDCHRVSQAGRVKVQGSRGPGSGLQRASEGLQVTSLQGYGKLGN